MNTHQPNYRFHTPRARISIIEKFNWHYEEGMQDWPLEISDHIDLAVCVQAYPQLVDDDEKFLLMEGMLYVLDHIQEEDFEKHSRKIVEFLKADFDIHQFTIYRWCVFEANEDRFTITPLMRNVWNSQSN